MNNNFIKNNKLILSLIGGVIICIILYIIFDRGNSVITNKWTPSNINGSKLNFTRLSSNDNLTLTNSYTNSKDENEFKFEKINKWEKSPNSMIKDNTGTIINPWTINSGSTLNEGDYLIKYNNSEFKWTYYEWNWFISKLNESNYQFTLTNSNELNKLNTIFKVVFLKETKISDGLQDFSVKDIDKYIEENKTSEFAISGYTVINPQDVNQKVLFAVTLIKLELKQKNSILLQDMNKDLIEVWKKYTGEELDKKVEEIKRSYWLIK